LQTGRRSSPVRLRVAVQRATRRWYVARVTVARLPGEKVTDHFLL
jgi:hypothetical protein